MKEWVKAFLIVASIIAGILTFSFSVHNTYASKSEVSTMHQDIKAIRQKVDELLIIVYRGVCE